MSEDKKPLWLSGDGKKKSGLDLIPERVINDKAFLMEVSIAGYDPLDPEDVHNYLEKLPPKNEQRNIILSGAYEGQSLGMSKASEDDVQRFMYDNPDLDIRVKKSEDLYLSDFSNKKRDLLLEQSDLDIDLDNQKPSDYIPSNQKINAMKVDNDYRTNLSKVFDDGSDDDDISKLNMYMPEAAKGVNNLQVGEYFQKNSSVEQILQLIKELKALGFSPDEIKKEIKLLVK